MESGRDALIRLLEAELDFIEAGGYGSPAGQPGKEPAIFDRSPACINHWIVPGHERECHDDCILLQAVPERYRAEALPCHFIPLNEQGDTVHSLDERGDRDRTLEAVRDWLKRTLRRLKAGEDALGPQDVKY